MEVHSTKEQVNSIEEHSKNDEMSSIDFTSSRQQLPNDSPLATTGRSKSDPVIDTGSNTLSVFQQIGIPTFTMPHSAAAQVLDTNCTRRKMNSITATGQSYVISMQLKMTSLTKSPKSIFSIVITMYPSTVRLLVKSFSTTPSLKLLDYLTVNTC